MLTTVLLPPDVLSGTGRGSELEGTVGVSIIPLPPEDPPATISRRFFITASLK